MLRNISIYCHKFIIEVGTMKRRHFLKTLFAGIFALFAKTAKAQKKPGTHFTMAMFWKEVD